MVCQRLWRCRCDCPQVHRDSAPKRIPSRKESTCPQEGVHKISHGSFLHYSQTLATTKKSTGERTTDCVRTHTRGWGTAEATLRQRLLGVSYTEHRPRAEEAIPCNPTYRKLEDRHNLLGWQPENGYFPPERMGGCWREKETGELSRLPEIFCILILVVVTQDKNESVFNTCVLHMCKSDLNSNK